MITHRRRRWTFAGDHQTDPDSDTHHNHMHLSHNYSCSIKLFPELKSSFNQQVKVYDDHLHHFAGKKYHRNVTSSSAAPHRRAADVICSALMEEKLNQRIESILLSAIYRELHCLEFHSNNLTKEINLN